MSSPVHLTRHDPGRNMARFYRVELLADLFGGVQLVRIWGRIGTAGRVDRRWYAEPDGPDGAEAAAEAWIRRKRRKGYRSGARAIPAERSGQG